MPPPLDEIGGFADPLSFIVSAKWPGWLELSRTINEPSGFASRSATCRFPP
jgi:hypothetical protein